ncbi:MAG: 3-oxoacid CoA-transferase subunit A [Spirochaetes bacterium]|nr:3-oxoacid CoA-transferase subunit A [Spirochaetota bacterium]NLJ05454.1 3-oxoacid CoA-transferase subunit A [Exilispira sp.]MBP8991783.1 3-oxoacid CoA-transferase subunit A [Spirochaetota bacterium]HOV46108.1 3-oxoacid CoA-transferase subunit A [Exilispira sp.]HPB47633.1 3-oxoacid CoA-transferase subunit A [Exilispira sp.]
MIDKPIMSAKEAVKMISAGSIIMVGGFMGCGTPKSLIDALNEQGTRDMTLICNDTAIYNPDKSLITGVAPLVINKRFKRIIASHIGTNRETGRQMNENETEVTLIPQGTLAEKIRAAGAGLGGILTPTGVGTEVEEGKQIIEIGGKKYLLELPLFADFALLKAKKADKAGNLVFSRSARNFNPIMAMAARTVIVEAEQIVEVGEINPDSVMSPFIFTSIIVPVK